MKTKALIHECKLDESYVVHTDSVLKTRKCFWIWNCFSS